ncbi:MAG: HD-GYP domain-containing protein [Chromatiaceae bacterium]|nr:HD-GYP domain-containing protein [Chromatiaceae bacterium]
MFAEEHHGTASTLIEQKQPTLRYKSSRKMTVPVGDLRLGMYVAELDRPWLGTPFLFQGFTIETERELELLREYCSKVTIDVESTVDFQIKTGSGGKPGPHTRTTTVSKRSQVVEREITRAQTAHAASSKVIRDIMDDVRLGKAVDTPAAREAVTECVDSVIANADALALLTRIREKDEYTSQHSLSVSILSVALGREMGHGRKELIEIGLCGLLHDVGKVLVPDEILGKPDRLSADEMEVMKQHTTFGRDILLSSSGALLKSVDVAHAHHERFDGSGYPRGLVEDQITPVTRIVAIADTFDAITSDRVYANARTNMDAFRILSRGRRTHWDPKLVIRFVEAIGIYPAGTAVELSNQMVGLVIESHPTLKLRPKLLVTHTPNGPLKPPMIVDLATRMQDQFGRKLQISRVLPPSSASISLHELRAHGVLENLHQLPEFGRT